VLICGRYEGVDERINQLYCDLELSIGDYVLSGGELAAAIIIDSVVRLLPGVLGNEASGEFESFGLRDVEITAGEEGVPRSQHGSGGLLDYPHYTRPAEFAGLAVPEVLLQGDHQQIRRWRREQQLLKTLRNRPDLLERAELTAQDRSFLAAAAHQPAFSQAAGFSSVSAAAPNSASAAGLGPKSVPAAASGADSGPGSLTSQNSRSISSSGNRAKTLTRTAKSINL
jgi:hypothetical protein